MNLINTNQQHKSFVSASMCLLDFKNANVWNCSSLIRAASSSAQVVYGPRLFFGIASIYSPKKHQTIAKDTRKQRLRATYSTRTLLVYNGKLERCTSKRDFKAP